MADISDVTSTLVGLITPMFYPAGISNQIAPSPLVNVPVRIYVGWPTPQQLDADLGRVINTKPAPICHLSVWPLPGERNVTRYLPKWKVSAVQTPTLTLTVSGQTVTVAGTIPPVTNPHNAVIFANGIPYGYGVQPTDTLTSIATALAALINVGVPGTISSGPVVTLPAGARLGAARIGVTGTSMREIKRQEKQIQITAWASTPELRTALAKLIDPLLAAMTFIILPDCTAGRLRYVNNREFDTAQKSQIYRRDLIYTVEYATMQTLVSPQVIAIGVTVQTPAQQTTNTFYE